MKLKKGDEVQILVGKDKGKRGKIERSLNKTSEVLLPGLNIFKRHMKKRGDRQPGGIMEFPRPLPVANVALVCPSCHVLTRVGYRLVKDKKERICKKCGNAV